ncbi:MAG TPA: tetratricopeptide repeat protein, partial [Bryobacteraceae bacterium]|nr:tetratricopeptide repeat protein [Bryobacteraceae bacterium]
MPRDSRRVRALACPFFLLAAYGISGTGQPSWEQCMAEMERFERESDYAQVEKALLAALNQYGQLAPQDPCLAVTLYKLGDFYRVLGRTREAERFYLRALSAGEKSAVANHSGLLNTL